jgi:hypothetical protein
MGPASGGLLSSSAAMQAHYGFPLLGKRPISFSVDDDYGPSLDEEDSDTGSTTETDDTHRSRGESVDASDAPAAAAGPPAHRFPTTRPAVSSDLVNRFIADINRIVQSLTEMK